ncbi:diacylglycerol/lipid kinase family protein [Deinococcus detaillensis]|uniref:diacylglycerol/lipid kinase family protein n=1 Tax=Deinococcus detaillensis TaxID=2592048 RepID=UPI00163D90B5|nr:diacylglycerol kinase family protein [Deinococcus detaillensis]
MIHNGLAGGAKHVTPEVILEALHGLGFDAEYHVTHSEKDLATALEHPGDLVVVAGGDGTVRAVACTILNRPDKAPALALIPLGTSNNIARSMGLTGYSPLDIARSLSTPRRIPFDVGLARGPWGERLFLESFGIGMLADLLDRYDPDAPKSVLRGVAAITGATLLRHAVPCQIEGLSETPLNADCLILEVVNTPTISNGVRLAPEASPSSGVLQLVIVEGIGAGSVAADLVALAAGQLERRKNVISQPVTHLRIVWDGTPVHLDAEIWPSEDTAPRFGESAVEIEVRPGALEIWVPTSDSAVK